MRVDDWVNVDFSLFKNIPIRESWGLQLRAEAFNVFNHMDLGNPATRLDQTTPGRISSVAHAPRQLQFGFRFLF
jgi:hypothetical protein